MTAEGSSCIRFMGVFFIFSWPEEVCRGYYSQNRSSEWCYNIVILAIDSPGGKQFDKKMPHSAISGLVWAYTHLLGICLDPYLVTGSRCFQRSR